MASAMQEARLKSGETGFPVGGGELGALIRGFDWAQTSLGPIADWPQSLKTVTGMLLLSPVPIVLLWGEEGVMIYNDAYSVFAGGRHPQLLGSRVREGWPEVAAFNDNVMKVGLAGNTLAYKGQELTLFRHGKPEPAWMNLDYSPVLDESGRPAGVIAIVVETTEQVLADRRLRDSEERFRALVNATSDVVYRMNADWTEMRALDGRGFLADTERPSVRWLDEYIFPADQPALQVAIDAAIAAKGVFQWEHRVRRADGTEGWTFSRAIPMLDEDGIITEWFGAASDVTDRRRAEQKYQQLAQSLEIQVEQRTRERDRVWRNTQDISIVLDPHGRFMAVNPATTKILGWPEDEMLGRSIFDFVLPEDIAETHQALERAGREALPSFVNRYRRKGGGFRWLSWVAAPDRELIYASARDITAEKESAEALAVSEEALRQAQKMEAVGQLTGGLAHDFNNILAGISGSLDLMQTRLAQGRIADIDRYVTAALGATRRAAALTHRLLAFSRRQTLDPKPTNINRLIAGMEDLIRRSVGPEIAIEAVAAAGLWNTLVDAGQLENALLNLCVNARDAMPDGGRLIIETGNRWLDERTARERDLPAGQYVSLCVSDNGTGMAPEIVARAFDPFFTTKPMGQGTGLGLSMIYGFARQSGGQVRIYSELGEGTMVCIYLPRHLGEAEVVEDAAAGEVPRAAAGQTVLVVDDEPLVRMFVTEVLEELGYQPLEAGDGIAGMKILGSEARIDLLITDVGLPNGLNGRQLAEAARELRPALKILFITGYAENAMLNHGHLLPGMHAMTKPIAMEALAAKVKDILDG